MSPSWDCLLWSPEWACRHAHLFWHFFPSDTLFRDQKKHIVSVWKNPHKNRRWRHFMRHRESTVNISLLDFRSKQQIHIWNLHVRLVLTIPIKLKHSKNIQFYSHFMELETSWLYLRYSLCFSYISRIWHPIQTANTYLKSSRFTGSNSTNNIEILQRLTILESFYGIRNILDICT